MSVELKDRSFRLPMRLLVKFSGEVFEGSFFIDNLSAGGLFIETTRPAPAGSKITVEFILPHNEDLCSFDAVVRWSRKSKQSEESPAGMGLEFLELPEERRQYLYDVIAQYRTVMG